MISSGVIYAVVEKFFMSCEFFPLREPLHEGVPIP